MMQMKRRVNSLLIAYAVCTKLFLMPKTRRFFSCGFIDILSLVAVFFLVATIVTGVTVVNKENANFDLRNKAAGTCDQTIHLNTAGTCPDGKTIKYVHWAPNCTDMVTDTCTGSQNTPGCAAGAVMNTAGTCPDGKTIKYVRLNADCKTTTTDTCPDSPATQDTPTTTQPETVTPPQTTPIIPDKTINTQGCDTSSRSYLSLISSCMTAPICDSITGVWTCPVTSASTPTQTTTTSTTPTQTVCNVSFLGDIGCGKNGCANGELAQNWRAVDCTEKVRCIPSTACATTGSPTAPACTSGQKQCSDTTLQTCSTGGVWISQNCASGCTNGACNQPVQTTLTPTQTSDTSTITTPTLISCSTFGACYLNTYTCEKSYGQMDCGTGNICGTRCVSTHKVGSVQCVGNGLETWNGSNWDIKHCGNGCENNACKPLLSLGSPCTSPDQCESGQCYATGEYYQSFTSSGFSTSLSPVNSENRCHAATTAEMQQIQKADTTGTLIGVGLAGALLTAPVAAPIVTQAASAFGTTATLAYINAANTLARNPALNSPTLRTAGDVLNLAQGSVAIIICQTQGQDSQVCMDAKAGMFGEFQANPAGVTEGLITSAQNVGSVAQTGVTQARSAITTAFNNFSEINSVGSIMDNTVNNLANSPAGDLLFGNPSITNLDAPVGPTLANPQGLRSSGNLEQNWTQQVSNRFDQRSDLYEDELTDKLNQVAGSNFNEATVQILDKQIISGRQVLEVKLPTGDSILCYRSTGTCTPGLKQLGDWQVIAGFAENGWFIKSGDTISLVKPGGNPYAIDLANYLHNNELLFFPELIK
jgi:hypothetical protein